MDIEDKVIVITGGTKGIGRDLALECAKRGAYVVILGRDVNAAGLIIEEGVLRKYKHLIDFELVDLNNVYKCEKVFESIYNKHKKIDGLVNYAGITPIASLLDCDESTFDSVIGVNFKAAFFCSKFAIKYMQKQRKGSIIFMNSCHAWRGEKDRSIYACSKGALLTLCEHIAYHYASDSIRANTITMGWSATDGELSLRAKQGIDLKMLERLGSQVIPMGRLQTAEDYIPGIIYLLSDDSIMVTGSNVRISGGLYL